MILLGSRYALPSFPLGKRTPHSHLVTNLPVQVVILQIPGRSKNHDYLFAREIQIDGYEAAGKRARGDRNRSADLHDRVAVIPLFQVQTTFVLLPGVAKPPEGIGRSSQHEQKGRCRNQDIKALDTSHCKSPAEKKL